MTIRADDFQCKHPAGDSFVLRAFSVAYREQKLYDNFFLTIPKGQWLGILGPSGVGKSTLLHAIANFIQHQHPENSVALLPQHHTLLPWLTVLQNIHLGSLLRAENMPECSVPTQSILQQVGLAQHALAYPHQLSGGQAQRAIIARTLYEKSDVVLMDEPFASLDAITKQSIHQVAYHAFHHKTVVLVTHDPLEALRLCDQLIVLQGTPVAYETVLTLDSNAPRTLHHPEVVLGYEALMEQLTHAAKNLT